MLHVCMPDARFLYKTLIRNGRIQIISDKIKMNALNE